VAYSGLPSIIQESRAIAMRTARLPSRSRISGLAAEFLSAENQPNNIRLAEI